jgi:hypothetical protein
MSEVGVVRRRRSRAEAEALVAEFESSGFDLTPCRPNQPPTWNFVQRRVKQRVVPSLPRV